VVKETVKTQITQQVGHIIGSAIYAVTAGLLAGGFVHAVHTFKDELEKRRRGVPAPATAPAQAPAPAQSGAAPAQPPVAAQQPQPQPAVAEIVGQLGAALNELRKEPNHAHVMDVFLKWLQTNEPHSFADLQLRCRHRDVASLTASLKAVMRQNNNPDRRLELKIQELTEHASEDQYLVVRAKKAEQEALRKTEETVRKTLIWAIPKLEARRAARLANPKKLSPFQRFARRMGN
jgi:hypothetical protein